MARTATRNGSEGNFKADVETHARKIRKDISALADSLATAGGTLADDAKANAGAKADELRQLSEDTVRELQNQLALVEKQIATRFRERPLTSLALAAAVGFLFAVMMRR
jgi:ElaB/YqjD/DUF883 family membrane-anchored ribosome-binding protein